MKFLRILFLVLFICPLSVSAQDVGDDYFGNTTYNIVFKLGEYDIGIVADGDEDIDVSIDFPLGEIFGINDQQVSIGIDHDSSGTGIDIDYSCNIDEILNGNIDFEISTEFLNGEFNSFGCKCKYNGPKGGSINIGCEIKPDPTNGNINVNEVNIRIELPRR